MIATQTFITFPEFADNGTNVPPEGAKYANGYIAAEVLPAEHLNYFFNGATKGVTDLNAGLSSVEAELNNVLAAGGETPNANNNSQVINAITYLIQQAKAEAIFAAHPVGSLYWSSKNTNPGTLFGGTWTQIKDKFILAAGDTYSNGATGGAAAITLTAANMPSHTHSFTPSGTVSSHSHGMNNHTHSFTPKGSVSVTGGNHRHSIVCCSTVNSSVQVKVPATSGKGSESTYYSEYSGNLSFTSSFTGTAGTTGTASGNTASATPTFTGTAGTTGSAGSGTAINKMPPYVVKYCWERTA